MKLDHADIAVFRFVPREKCVVPHLNGRMFEISLVEKDFGQIA